MSDVASAIVRGCCPCSGHGGIVARTSALLEIFLNGIVTTPGPFAFAGAYNQGDSNADLGWVGGGAFTGKKGQWIEVYGGMIDDVHGEVVRRTFSFMRLLEDVVDYTGNPTTDGAKFEVFLPWAPGVSPTARLANNSPEQYTFYTLANQQSVPVSGPWPVSFTAIGTLEQLSSFSDGPMMIPASVSDVYRVTGDGCRSRWEYTLSPAHVIRYGGDPATDVAMARMALNPLSVPNGVVPMGGRQNLTQYAATGGGFTLVWESKQFGFTGMQWLRFTQTISLGDFISPCLDIEPEELAFGPIGTGKVQRTNIYKAGCPIETHYGPPGSGCGVSCQSGVFRVWNGKVTYADGSEERCA